MQPIDMPPPYGGMNEVVPKVAIESPYCEKLYNFNVTQDGVTLRFGDSKYSSTLPTYPITTDSYGDIKLFTAGQKSTGEFVIVEADPSGGTRFTSAAPIAGADVFPVIFNKYMFWFIPQTYAPGVCYDGVTTYAVIGYTAPSGTFSPMGGCVHGRRLFIIQYLTSSFWYTNIDQVTGSLADGATGASTLTDLSSQMLERGYLVIIAPVTLSDTVATVQYVAFIFTTGEVMFYQGDYPNASNWSIVGRSHIAPPLGARCQLQYQGDTLIMTYNGIVSLRDLFLKGSQEAAGLTISDKVQATYGALMAAISPLSKDAAMGVTSAGAVWDKLGDRLIFYLPYYLDSNGAIQNGAFYFIFYIPLRSWFIHRSMGITSASGAKIFSMCRYKNLILFLGTDNATGYLIFKKEGSTSFTDYKVTDNNSRVAYDYEIISAPISNGKSYVSVAKGLDVIIKSDLYSQTNYTFKRDLGVQETTAQTIPDQGATLQKPFVNMGIEGTYIQYRLTGTTTTDKTVGLTLYATNVWVEQGKQPR